VLPAVRQANVPLHYEAAFRSVSTLLLDAVESESSFMLRFFGDTDAFDNVFGKSIFHAMESLEQHLIGSWDAVGCLLLVLVNQAQREYMGSTEMTLLANFFQRVQVRHTAPPGDTQSWVPE
jgi:hypothetical protein